MKHHTTTVPRLALVALLATLCIAGCSRGAQGDARTGASWAIALHGGAGTIPRDLPEEDKAQYLAALEDALRIGSAVLVEGGTSLDAVEKVVRRLEDDPLFNAGRGSVLTGAGEVEMDACIADGRTKANGAVTGVRTVRNPVSLARLVMTDTRHVLLAGDGAEAFARQKGVALETPDYFITPRQREGLQKAKEREKKGASRGDAGSKFGTVGCVALDVHGNLAAATSTGGLTNKMPGRIGDTPIFGAGTYADNGTCAVSGTGVGERFIQHSVAFHIAARMRYLGESLEESSEAVIGGMLDAGIGGIIAVDGEGGIVMRFNTDAMLRAAADSSGRFEAAIWE